MKLSKKIHTVFRTVTRNFLASLLVAGILIPSLSGCPQNPGAAGKKSMKIALYGADASKTWNVWAWKEKGSADENYDAKAWPGGTYQLTNKDENGCVFLNMDIDTSVDLGILFVASGGSPQTEDIIVPSSVLGSTDELYFTYSTMDYYTTFESMAGIKSAQIVSADGTHIEAKIVTNQTPSADDIVVKDSDGNTLAIKSVAMSGITATITLSAGAIEKIPYTISFGGATITAGIKTSLIDEIFDTTDTNFGVTVSGKTASFTMWSPLASKVQLALYADSGKVSSDTNATLRDMSFDSASGSWSISGVDVTGFKYYKYAVTNAGKTKYVADIWHGVASADSVASQIASVDDEDATPDSWEAGYTNPFGNTGSETKSYSDAIIYEMHIRDWSRAAVPGSTGKFLDIANSTEIINHLKDLGVTHVQILPMFDYAETNADANYNWGYNPYHYNVPEGRYVTSGYEDGTQAVKEMRAMIKALHDAGISVVMDVVYNHTSGTGDYSLYDMTVPEYFYRINSDGSYSNGSGCGNEVATNHAVVKKYVIDSLKHWMNDYHINGFRFDLMGCLEADTMKDIYDALYEIDKNVLVYGEPWTGGTSAVKSGAKKAGKGTAGTGYGAFDDDFRDAIKGAEFGGFGQGQVQGNFSAEENLMLGLCGSEITKNSRNKTGVPALALHYAECHDNYTLFDKLAISFLGKTSYSGNLFNAIGMTGLSEVKKQDKLAAAYVLLSQGTPFINGGQEFLRTKQGDENSYKSNDSINAINLSFKETYSDVYNTYKGLIALRKANSDAFGANSLAEAEVFNSTKGVTKYTTGDFLVYFNATSADVTIDTTGYTKVVDVTSGTPEESTTLPATVGAKNFVILKK